MNEAAPSGGPSGWANRVLQVPAGPVATVAGSSVGIELSAPPWPSARLLAASHKAA